MKTSEVTPLPAYKFAELVKEAGFPPVSVTRGANTSKTSENMISQGVVNIITGYGHTAGNYLASHKGVSKMAFTGSTMTGRKIMESSSTSNLKKLQLELGGKSAQIVCADADLENAAKWASEGIFNNHGQSCNAGSRILVDEKVHDRFLELFINHTKTFKLGDPFAEDTIQGRRSTRHNSRRS